ncbi:MAG: tRNA epoxyqueuosine(34) reductase QueG [Bacteroidales bacterium]|nr:tRNA epoxyqueuosine(34) reductase QueG [Bacteroidales bacterium]
MHNALKKKAKELGFDLCGIAQLRSLDDHGKKLKEWLERGHHAGMSYMNRNVEKRLDPELLVENARSVIVTGMNYYSRYEPEKDQPVFSRYALGQDYHKVIKDRLYRLLSFIRESHPGAAGRVFVDTAPVLERAWAVEAGLGWIGKNSMLINKKLGSYFFLGLIITDAELDADIPGKSDYCGNCRKCIDACPTSAIMGDRTIDSNKCISYLSIEHKGDMPSDYREKAGRRVFGCDICQEVCPWNKKAPETKIREFEPLPEIVRYTSEQWKNISSDEFYSIFENSAVLRTGYNGFMRNIRNI